MFFFTYTGMKVRVGVTVGIIVKKYLTILAVSIKICIKKGKTNKQTYSHDLIR